MIIYSQQSERATNSETMCYNFCNFCKHIGKVVLICRLGIFKVAFHLCLIKSGCARSLVQENIGYSTHIFHICVCDLSRELLVMTHYQIRNQCTIFYFYIHIISYYFYCVILEQKMQKLSVLHKVWIYETLLHLYMLVDWFGVSFESYRNVSP